MVRYHGVLSSRAKLRAELAPSPPEAEPDPLQLQAELPRFVEPDETPRRKPWAWLLGLEPDGMVRVGMLHDNTADEVDRLVDAVAALRR